MSHAGSAIDIEQRLEKKLNDKKSCNNSTNNINKNDYLLRRQKSLTKKIYKSFKTLTSMLKSDDTVVNISASATYVNLWVTSVSLTMLPKSAGIAFAL